MPVAASGFYDLSSEQGCSSSYNIMGSPSWSLSPIDRSLSPSSIREEDLRLLDPTYCPIPFSQTQSIAQVYIDSSGELHDPGFCYFPPLRRSGALSPIEEEKEEPTPEDDEYAWYMSHPQRRVSRPGRSTPRSNNSVIGLGLGLDQSSKDIKPTSRPVSIATSTHTRTDSNGSLDHPDSMIHYYSSDMSTSCTSLESGETSSLAESSMGLGMDVAVAGTNEAWLSSNSSTALSGDGVAPHADEDAIMTVKVKSIRRFLPRSASYHDGADSAASSSSSLASVITPADAVITRSLSSEPIFSRSKRSSRWLIGKDAAKHKNSFNPKRLRPLSFFGLFTSPSQ